LDHPVCEGATHPLRNISYNKEGSYETCNRFKDQRRSFTGCNDHCHNHFWNKPNFNSQPGMQFLLPRAIFMVFLWPRSIRPLETGVGLILPGLLTVSFFGNIGVDSLGGRLIGSPTLITGLLLIGAGSKFHRLNDI
jgi:hypothetical protein